MQIAATRRDRRVGRLAGACPWRTARGPCPSVSLPSSVVRSIIRIARSSAQTFDSFLIERRLRPRRAPRRPTWSTAVTRPSRLPSGPGRAVPGTDQLVGALTGRGIRASRGGHGTERIHPVRNVSKGPGARRRALPTPHAVPTSILVVARCQGRHGTVRGVSQVGTTLARVVDRASSPSLIVLKARLTLNMLVRPAPPVARCCRTARVPGPIRARPGRGSCQAPGAASVNAGRCRAARVGRRRHG